MPREMSNPSFNPNKRMSEARQPPRDEVLGIQAAAREAYRKAHPEGAVEINPDFKKDMEIQQAIDLATTLKGLADSLRGLMLSEQVGDAPTKEALKNNAQKIDELNEALNKGISLELLRQYTITISRKLGLRDKVIELIDKKVGKK